MKRAHADPEYKQRHREGVRRAHADPEYRRRRSEAMRRAHADPEYKRRRREARNDPEYKRRYREGMKRAAAKRHAEQGPSSQTLIKQIIVRHPNITLKDLRAQLAAGGHIINNSTIAQTWSDTRATLRVMRELGWIPPLPIRALPLAAAAD
jgi:hypothetical protein